MSKEKEELSKILDNLERFAKRTDSHVLALVLRHLSDEEADELPVAGDEVNWVVVGDVSSMLDNIKSRFHDTLKKMEEGARAMARDMEKK